MANDLMAGKGWLLGQFLPWGQFNEDSSNNYDQRQVSKAL